mgnify:CR=1 FL=1
MKNEKAIVVARNENRKSKFAVNHCPVYVSDNMTAKMDGVPAISTNCKCNKYCLSRMKKGEAVCASCFAVDTLKQYGDCADNVEYNTELLTSRILSAPELPIFNNRSEIVRFEAFGDLNNETQAINYINIAKANPAKTFALWTKNTGIIKRACDTVGKPKNLVIIQSSLRVNEKAEPANGYIDKVFTVYSKEYATEHEIKINCGARSCAKCRRCYNKRTARDIAELLK